MIILDEGILSNLKDGIKKSTDAFTKDEALKKAKSAATSAGDPMHELVMRHKKAKLAALKEIKYEFTEKIKGDENGNEKGDQVGFWNSCIKNNKWVGSADGYMILKITIASASKKGWISRIFSGSMSKMFTKVGVMAMQKYVEIFLGKAHAKKVNNNTVFGFQDEENGKTGYYICFNLKQNEELNEALNTLIQKYRQI